MLAFLLMKRGSRKGSKGRDKKNDQKNNDRNQDRSSDRAESRPGKRADDRSNDRGKSRNEGSSKPGKRKGKDIKNARSLSDVLGGGARSGGAVGRDMNRNAPTNTGSSIPRRDNDVEVPNRSKGELSSKLTYIMTFQPPEQRNANSNTTSYPVRVEVETKAPSRPDGSRPSAERVEVKSQNRGAIDSKQESSWPKGRMARTPARESTSDSRESRGHDPKARHDQGGKHPRANSQLVTGMIKRHPDGFGFLIADDSETPDVYVARQSMVGIMTNDKVEVELYRPRSGKTKNKEERLSGEIVRVISRANKTVVGRYLPVDKKYGVLQDENKGWGTDLRILAVDSMDAKEGELVAVEITQYPDDEHEFTGRVVTIIGDVEDPINDVIRVVHQASIPTEFSKQAIADAQRFGGEVKEQERRGREDLTDLPLITIDGVTAKDFDDAVYTEQTDKGFRLVVAIADVSHYVKPGTRLDEEAYERGTSTYFPNFVVPMLPEELSNELCSLKPHVLRLCFCCEMFLDFQGAVQSYRFFEGVMESKARVTYGEAQEVIDAYANGDERSNQAVKRLSHVTDNILRSADLAKVLMRKRFEEGSLDLEIPETQVVVDSTGESTDIIRASRLFAHRLIEELMLITNVCTARFLENAKVPGIYRVHEEPDQDNIKNLQRYLWNMGGSRSVMGGNLAMKLTKALEAMSGKPEAQVLNILTLRTMQQAHYSENNVGHFGLGFSHYSHFTSPIRRYPDLIAHRIIKSQLYDKYKNMEMSEDELQSATTWLSATEQRSTKAERKVISIKKARFIRRYVGEEFDGMISSVAKFGVFVLLRQFDVDGLVKIENLGNDRFEFDDENLRLVGRKSGLQYSIGDQVKVIVAGADPETGKVDFELSEIISQNGEDGADGDKIDSFFDEERGARGARKPGKPGPRKKSREETNAGNKKKGSDRVKGSGKPVAKVKAKVSSPGAKKSSKDFSKKKRSR